MSRAARRTESNHLQDESNMSLFPIRFLRPLAALLGSLSIAAAVLFSAPAAAQAPAPAPAAAAATETISNPYGLDALWRQGDFVARGTLIIMVIMSMGSWYIIFTKLFEQRKLMKSAEARPELLEGRLGEGRHRQPGRRQRLPLHRREGVNASEHHEGTLVEKIDLHTWRVDRSAPSTTSTAGCRTAWPSWPPSARPRPSSACSARSGASTTR